MEIEGRREGRALDPRAAIVLCTHVRMKRHAFRIRAKGIVLYGDESTVVDREREGAEDGYHSVRLVCMYICYGKNTQRTSNPTEPRLGWVRCVHCLTNSFDIAAMR